MSGGSLSEAELERLERARDPESIPELVRTIRQLQHDLDSLRLGMEVARSDREELRAALYHAREELRRLKG
ncbi:MAG TPA: hypothetical protein VFU47_15530 [Armatimonadota bacterium]|nr:hypothetical protein [Armatimonadota bacterium]